MLYPLMNTLPQSPLLIHSEPEDARRFVRPGMPLPTLPRGPSPSLPRIPEAPSVMMSLRPVTFQGVEETAERIKYFRSSGPEWTDAAITKTLLSSGISQTEITAAFASLRPQGDGRSTAFIDKPVVRYALWGLGIVAVTGAGYLVVRRLRR